MPTNDFLPFAGGGGANVIDQADYAALPAIVSGYASGVAKSIQVNKTLRQATIMAAVLAQFIVDETGANATDDGTTATLLANLKSAVGVIAKGRLLRTSIYTNPSGTVMLSIDGATPTASSSFTSHPLATSREDEAIGGGGAGAGGFVTTSGTLSAGSGGASGSYAKGRYTATLTGAAVAIGAGGAANSGAAGGNGGTTSLASELSCPGGGGGTGATAASSTNAIAGQGAPGASPTGGNIISARGQPGPCGFMLSGTPVSGQGASGPWGGGGPNTVSGAGAPGSAPGAGGSGGANNPSQSSNFGGAGSPGILIIREYA